MDAMIAEELYSTLYNGKDKTVHGTVISENKETQSNLTETNVEKSHEKETLTRHRRDAVYINESF
jgi:hypothetical protein